MPRKRNTDPGVYRYTLQSGATRWGAILYASPDWETGRRRQKRKQGFATKAEAAAWRVAQLNERHRGTDQIEPSKQPLGTYLDDWLASLTDLAPSTRRSYRNNLVAVRPHLAHVPLAQITPVMIEQFHAMRARRGDPPAGIYFTHRILKRALRKAFHLGMIPANPYDRVRAPREPGHETTTWTLEQMTRFLAINAHDPVWGVLWQVICETWIRVGEAAALTWNHIDLEQRTMRIDSTVSRNDDLVYVTGPTKTASSRRTIRLSEHLTRVLATYKEATTGDLVFPGPRGQGFLQGSVIGKALKRACVAAGVPIVAPHELRHNGSSLAYMSGVDIKAISERMGHASIGITLAVYTHLNDTHHQAAADAIATLFGAPSDTGMTNDERET